MNVEPPPKFMRPRPYARRVGVDWRTAYRYISDGLWPAYKFQGVLLIDVEEVDCILKGMIKRKVAIGEQRTAAAKARAVKAQVKAEKIKAAADKARLRADKLVERAKLEAQRAEAGQGAATA
jgi:predicted site-specific integrase-resolvase